jgi:hypothetical protein
VLNQTQYKELNTLVKKYLTDTPTPSEKLLSDLQPANEQQLLETIRLMLDYGELYYDEQGRLAVD